MKKKILAVFLSLCMAMSLFPIGAMAVESEPKDLNQDALYTIATPNTSSSTTSTTCYWEIPSGNYKLTGDINLDRTIAGATSISLRFGEGLSTLDLNGHSITSSNMAVITNQGTLTIKDSSDKEDGKITGYRGVDNYGALTLSGGTIEGTTSGYFSGCIFIYANETTFTMSGGKVASEQAPAIGFNPNKLSEFTQTQIEILGGSLGTIALNGKAAELTVGSADNETDSNSIQIEAITTPTNKWSNNHYTINLKGGTIGLLPAYDNVTYTGFNSLIIDTTNCPGGYHFENKDGGHKLVQNTDPVAKIGETSYYYLPDAVAALQDGNTLMLMEGYNITNSSEALTITVPGVTLDLNGYDITVTGDVSNPPVTCKAKTGTFKITNSRSEAATITPVTGKNYTVPAVQISSGSAATVEVDTEDVNLTNGIRLTGGRIKDTPANRKLVAVGGSYDGLCTITFGDAEKAEGYIYAFGDLDAIVKQAEDGVTSATVTLLGDADTSIKYSTNEIAMTVDLAGHTVAASSGNSLISIPDNADKTNLTVKNGTINAQGISAASVLSENCVLTLENLSMTSGGDFGIATNGSAAGSDGSSAGLKLTLTNCSLQNTIKSESGTVGIYFPVHDGTLTINNSQITQFDMGVQAISGSTTIKGDQTEITGSGREIENDSGDGPRFDGAALSVLDREGYGDLATVKIEAGSFSTPADSDYGAVHVSGFKENQFTDDFENNAGNTQIVQVSGGTFTSSVKEYVTDELKAELYSAGSGTYTYYPNTEAAADNAKPGDAVSNITETTSHTIKVVYDNGTADQTITVGGNATYILPAAPTRSGYAFQGWNDGTRTYQPGATVKITADTTFTAVWTYIPPANPNYKISIGDMANGTITANPSAAKAGATVTLTATPDEGYALGTLTVTDRFGDAVKVSEQANGTYTFTMPDGQVTVNATFVASEEPTPAEPFTDVDENDWFYDAVVYAYENGLMNGVENNQFAPNTATNRAMLATILYRLAGESDVSGDMPFTDVAVGTWYTDAVLWAAQNGIVNGLGEDTFAPMNTLTREQLVTMLYRYAEAEGYDVSAAADLSGYPDAGKVQTYAQEAMSWAVAEGIVEGMDGNLNPAGNATRAQIATILMRFCEGVAK